MKLWISTAVGASAEPWGTLAVIAETRDEAIDKARQRLEQMTSPDPDAERYRRSLLENVESMTEAVYGDVFIDADPYVVKRYA